MMNRGTAIILIFLVISAVLLWFAPAEQTLGQWIKLIYFHGTLSYAGLYAFYAAALLGLAYLVSSHTPLGLWSWEIGLWAVVVWFVSVALSLVSMQVVWGGLFWAEPRTIAAITMLVLGVGKEAIASGGSLKLKSGANIAFAAAVLLIRRNMGMVMHPDNPIGASDSVAVKVFPLLLLILTIVTIIEFSRWRLSQSSNKGMVR
ncbi:MAG: hypothetical protein KGZ63_13365 [Clostridiales bacterium]|jgi:hypothetical protein|nr:hypothetical protein [Clostridiales bacterium]